MYLLANATHQTIDVFFEGDRICLQPGQLITSRKSISQKFNVNEYKVQRILKLFENEQQIAQQTTPHNRLISVLNWDLYQNDAQQDEHQLHNRCTTDAQQLHTNCTQTRRKEGKKERREEGKKSNKAEIDLSFISNTFLLEPFKEFVEHRKQIKCPMTQLAAVKAYQQLLKLSPSVDDQIQIINNSIASGWKGLFALKDQPTQKTTKSGRWEEFYEPERNDQIVFHN